MNMPDTASGAGSDNRSAPPSGERSDPSLELRARENYREASRHLDPATAGRLRAARRQALEAAREPSRAISRWLIPTGAFAVIALAALMVWQPSPHGAGTTNRAATATNASADVDNELPPDADKTDPVLYQNLDFYGWLAATDSPSTTH